MTEEKRKPTPEEKARAAAEAKAKAEELRKQKEQEAAVATKTDEQPDIAKAKADAAAKAKAAAAAAAAAKAKAARQAAEGNTAAAGGNDADAKAKAAAAAKAKAAAAAAAKAKATANAEEEPQAPKPPSKNQPYLDKYVKIISESLGADVIESAYINELAKEVPTLIVKNDKWLEVARLLKQEEALHFEYLSNLHGIDYEDRMEVYYHLYSYKNEQSLAVKVKTDREQPTIPSVTSLWEGARWNERETYDLLGIRFAGHENLRRIMLPDEWVGHPLRKDYEQYDEEV